MNPDGSFAQTSALAAAVSWIELTLVGNLAVSVATIAVAWFGLMLLSGRVSSRRGVKLILGCFIIFGASSIANGITSMMMSDGRDAQPSPQAPVMAVAPPAPQAQASANYDPYAGAALPRR